LALSRQQLEAAIKKLQQTGDRWEENGARYHLALVYYHLGRLAQAAELARETQAIGVALDDRLAAGDNLFTWARASGGVLPWRALELEKKHANPDIQRACELLGAEAIMVMREGRYQLAQELLGQGIALYKARRAQSMYSAALPCWLLTALRLGAQSQSGAERRCSLERANKVLKPALRLAKSYRNNLPHTLREQALLLALMGKQQAAESALAQSLQVASELGMGGELGIGQRVTAHWNSGDSPVASDEHDWMLLGLRS
jgi:tetratricopeptide (TPR) repeat protein